MLPWLYSLSMHSFRCDEILLRTWLSFSRKNIEQVRRELFGLIDLSLPAAAFTEHVGLREIMALKPITDNRIGSTER